MSLGNLASQAVLQRILGKTGQYVAPTNIFVAVSNVDPGDDGTSIVEPTDTYARISTVEGNWVNPTLANPSVSSNSIELAYVEATAAWLSGAVIQYFSLWRHLTDQTAANFIWGGPLTDQTKDVAIGDTLRFAINALAIDLT